MSGTPPFCPIGEYYYLFDKANADIQPVAGAPSTAISTSSGRSITISTIGGGYDYNTFTNGVDVIPSRPAVGRWIEMGFTLSNWPGDVSGSNYAGIGLGTYSGGNYAYLTAQSGSFDIIQYLAGSVSYVATSGDRYKLRIKVLSGLSYDYYVYANDILIASTLNYNFGNIQFPATIFVYGGFLPSASRTLTMSDIYYLCDGLSGVCGGSVPTAHREIVSSTAKISHSRILQEHRTAPEAQRFHDWMKNAT